MRHLLITLVWLALVSTACALSVELPINPDNLDQSNYKFSVTAKSTNSGIAFHVTITSKHEDIDSDYTHVDLSIVTHTKNKDGANTGTSIAPLTPSIPIALEKQPRIWTADFTVPAESLSSSGLCFVFSETVHTTTNGKRVAFPSATFYEVKLKDFTKP